MSPSKVAEKRSERERCAREAARRLADVIEELDAIATFLETAGQPPLHNRTVSLRQSAGRLQADVASVVGDLVRERVVEAIAAENGPRPGRTLSVA